VLDSDDDDSVEGLQIKYHGDNQKDGCSDEPTFVINIVCDKNNDGEPINK
jgi:hypothetical protein